ncbi:beta strand repeat-containing protein, partial [Nanoarchaeota archaeon]
TNYEAASNTSGFTINKASTTLNLTASPSWTETYGTATTVNCTADNSEVTPTLYRNGTPVSIPDVQTLGAGTYGYVCNASATQNYTGDSTSNTLTITQTASTMALYLNGSQSNLTVTYGTASNATAIADFGSVTLYRNGTPVSNPEIATLGAGLYNYTAIGTGDANHTGSSETWYLTVNPATPVLTLAASPAWTVNNGTQTTINCTADTAEVTPTLYRNGTPVSIPDVQTLPIAEYEYVCNSSATQNYTTASETNTLEVTAKITTACSLAIVPSSGQTYPVSANATCSCTNPEAGATLWRNGTNVGATENNTFIALAAGDYGYVCNVSETANYSSGVNSTTYVVNKATTTLNLTAAPSWSETYGTQTTINCTADNSEVTPALYRNGTPVSIPDVQTLGAGDYGYVCNATATQNYTGDSESNTLTINQAGSTTNLYINGSESNLTATYGTATNATAVTDFGTVALYRNGTPVSNPEITVLGAGFYNYTAIGSGDTNHTGSSVTWYVTINKVVDILSLYLNGNLNQNITITYGTQSNATGTSVSGTEKLYREGPEVSNPDIATLNAGQYAYTVNTTGNANYTADSTTVNATCTCTNNETDAKLYRNGTDVTSSENNTYVLLAAATWNYICNSTETTTYSATSNTSDYIINKATTTLNLTAAPSWTETYGTATTVNCTADNSEVTPTLYRNGTPVSIPDVQTLGAGNYGYVCNASASQNYTGNSTANTLTINKAGTSTQLYLNGSQANITVTFGTATNATAVTDVGTVTLYRNGTPVSNPEIATLGAGSYQYTATNPGDENHTGSSETWYVTVNTAADDINLYINGNLNQNITITYGTQSNATGTSVSGTELLYRDGAGVANPEIATLNAGQYAYTVNTTGNQNYTADSTGKTYYLTINKADSTCSLVFDKATPQTYSTQLNASCSCTNPEADAELWRNSTNVTSSEENQLVTLPAGSWNYVCNASTTTNYEAASNTSGFTINKASTTLNLTASPSWTETYGTATTVNCTADNSEVTPTLYRNGTPVSIPDVQTLGAGTYGYVCNASATQNYTGDSESNTLTINKASTSTQLYLNGSQANITVTYGTATNATAVTDTGTVTLYRNGTPVSNPEIATLGAGFYQYTATNPGDENHTGSSETWYVTVNTAADDINLYINGNLNQNVTITYGTQSNATGTSVSGTELLYRDGAGVANPEIATLNAGVYSYTVNTTGNQNYTSNSTGRTHTLTVNKAGSTCSLVFDKGTPQTYGTQLNASCSCTNPEADAEL